MAKRHFFHLVDRSPWPFVSSCGAFFLTIGLVFFMHRVKGGLLIFLLGLMIILLTMYVWWRDVLREGSYQGRHTRVVQKGLKMGFYLFVVSEVMLFFAFFWAFFHSSLSPAIVFGIIWPPVDIHPVSTWHVPLANTALLVASSVTVTAAHHSLVQKDYYGFEFELIVTLVLGVLFMYLQVGEYIHTSFDISDSVYGSTFFLLTGLHGMHVTVGGIFIFVCLVLTYVGHVALDQHIGFECAVVYWHFVDVVWLFLFFFVYVWGNA